MKVLNFIIGMIVGMILLVVAVVGAVFAAGTLVSVGQLENTIGSDIFDDDSDIVDKTLLEAAQELIKDLKDIDNLTIEKLRTKYGLKIPTEVSGIDISVLFNYPIKEVPDHLGDVVNNMTLRDVGEFLEMDFAQYELPILDENLDNNVNVALDNILSSIDGDNITVHDIEANFGITLGKNAVLDQILYTPLASFGDVMNGLTVGMLIDADCDAFFPSGNNDVYVVTDEYEEVSASDYGAVKDGAETYLAGVDGDKNLVYKELRYVRNEDGSYKVDNSSNAADFAPDAENPVTYYRHIVRKDYAEGETYPEDTVFCVAAYSKSFARNDDGSYSPVRKGYINLDTLYTDASLTLTLNDIVNGAVIDINECWYETETESGGSPETAASFGVNPEILPSADTKLEEGFGGWLRAHKGTADEAIQAIADESVNSLANATDSITSLKLGDVLSIDENSAKILQTLKDTPINKMSDAIDNIVLSDATQIDMSLYVPNGNGSYVYVPAGGKFVPYDREAHGGNVVKYTFEYAEAADGSFVLYNGVYYRYNAGDERFEGCPRYEKNFVKATESNPANGLYVSEGGYYTLYTPGAEGERFDKMTTEDGKDYLAATQAQIADGGITKYYYDDTERSMKEWDGVSSDEYDLYVIGTASPSALQRLAYVAIPDVSEEFAKVVLSDAMSVDVDTFMPAGDNFDPDADYYIFEQFYKRVDDVTEDNFDSYGKDLYVLTRKGTSNAVLKMLAYVGIDQVSFVMDDIIESTLLSEIIDVAEYYTVAHNASEEVNADSDRWIMEYNPYYSVETADGGVNRYTYVYDGKGKYYRTDYLYLPAEDGQAVEKDTVNYHYENVSQEDFVRLVNTLKENPNYLKENKANFFVQYADGSFAYNPTLLAYYAAQSISPNQNGVLSKLYKRVAGSGNGEETKTVYANSPAEGSGLYISVFGNYVKYDPSDLTHAGEQLYFKYTGGYYKVSPDTAGESKYYFDYSTGTFVGDANGNTGDYAYVKMPETSDGKYYFSEKDKNFPAEGAVTYSLNRCEYIFKEYDGNTASEKERSMEKYVFVNDGYVPFDENEPSHANLPLFVRYTGYLGTANANMLITDGGYDKSSALSDNKVSVVTEKSPTILVSFLRRNVSIGSLNDALKEITIGELMDVTPGSIFDEEAIKNSTIDTISSTIDNMLNTMTIGKLMQWASVSDVDPQVKYILQDITLTDFFGALEFDGAMCTIKVNIEKLFKIE